MHWFIIGADTMICRTKSYIPSLAFLSRFFAALILVCLGCVLLLNTKPVNADAAEDYCQTYAENNTIVEFRAIVRTACIEGYSSSSLNGCSSHTRQATKEACEAGYNEKVRRNPPSGPNNRQPPQSNLRPGNEIYDWCAQQYPEQYVRTDPAALRNACIHGYTSRSNQSQDEACRSFDSTVIDACREGWAIAGTRTGDASRDIPDNSKCDVQFIGLIVCWVSKFITVLVSGLFKILTQLMITPPITDTVAVGDGRVDSQGNAITPTTLYDVWRIFASIANAFFVILILMVIFSQVTNFGLDNYALKKILPRIIVGAILINTSFIICQLLVDLSNVIGNSLYGVLENIAKRLGGVQPDFSFGSGSIALLLTVGAGYLIYLNIMALLPMLISGLVAVLITVIILVVRQALIIIFIVLSPLAFALNILPNTQEWFSKWWKNFFTILMLFPVVAFVFGASQILAAVVSRGAAGQSGLIYVMFIIAALAAQLVPFFFTPLIVRAAGGLTNQISGRLKAPAQSMGAKAHKRAGEMAEDFDKKRTIRALGTKEKDGKQVQRKGLYARRARRKAVGDQVAKYHEDQLKSHKSGAYGEFVSDEQNERYFARKLSRDSKIADKVSKRNEIRSSMGAMRMQLEVVVDEAAEAMLTDEEYTLGDLRSSIESNRGKDGRMLTDGERNAMLKRLGKEGSLDDIHALIDKLSEATDADKSRDALIKGIAQNAAAKDAAHLDARGLEAVRNGASVGQLYSGAVDRGAYNPETLASQSTTALKGLAQHRGSYSATGTAALQNSRDTVIGKTKYSTRVTGAGQRHLSNL